MTPAETAWAYLEVLEEYLGRYGRPASRYSDEHSVFRVNRPDCEGEPAQFARALKALDIEAVHANTPQAKGGVERANRTLQDRMVKLMRLDGVNNMEEGKAWLPGFMAGHNARFAAAPADPRDARRPVLQDPETPALILCPHHQRALSQDLTFRLHHRQYQVQTPEKGCGLRGARVAGCEGWDDNITVIYRGEVRPVRLLAARGAADIAGRPQNRVAPRGPGQSGASEKTPLETRTRPPLAPVQKPAKTTRFCCSLGGNGDDILTLRTGDIQALPQHGFLLLARRQKPGTLLQAVRPKLRQ